MSISKGFFPPSLSPAIHIRTLYAYKSQCPEDLSLVENIVIEAHPSKTDDDWMYGTDVKSGRTGTFPKAYVMELEATWGKVLYGYTASSADEVSLIEDEMVAVVDTSDPDWLKVKEQGRIGLAPGAYIQLTVSWKDPVGGLSLMEKFLANLLPSPCQVTPSKVDHPPMSLIKCYVSPSS
ncbi:hypothetical protein PPACK8108_LOCUS5796 [Phakopsora pachyrhizi]|uniref:SH3 domain-containing protein n=1 Tax=Phakopsora pachyrhizi TaxID=170000 RepID=A0AAV0ARL3_PHAPC|nr:hypothetical protein PPACK8108_LOCUS5796 [Phakopsora pachyrhizi]